MKLGMVAAGHEATARAAMDILEAGGNAFDAAVAAGFAASAAEPVLTSLGGGGFLLAHSGEGIERLYDFFVQTPRRLAPIAELDFHPIQADFGPTTQEFHIGLGAIAVPGTVAGLFAVQQDLGRLSMQEVLEPALRLCREGVVISAFQEYLFQVVGPIYRATEEARKVFGSPGSPGRLVKAGDRIRFPELAQTLEALGREGPELFYRGILAHRLVEQSRQGGSIERQDLESYQVELRVPLEFEYHGNRLLTNPPPSCGGSLIAFTLKLLEALNQPLLPPESALDLIRLAWAMDFTNQARADILGRNEEWNQAAADLLESELMESYRAEMSRRGVARRGTTHLNVLDSKGNVASLSLSNGEGCGHLLTGTGIMLNNMLGEEDLCPQGFQQFPLNRRMSSMMAPTLMFQPDGRVVALGSGGSNRIRTAIVQVIRHLTVHRMAVDEAVQFPRIHFERGLLSVEAGFPEATLQALQGNFPELRLWENKNLFFGGVHVVTHHPKEGFSGTGDPRRTGVCLEGHGMPFPDRGNEIDGS